MNPKISIILPTWKDSKSIEKSIESVKSQSFLDWELIIVDDGLYKDRLFQIKEFIKDDERIILLENKENLGIQKSLNLGLKKSKGDYIARIDDDDLWINKDKLKKQFEFLEENPDYVLIGSGAKFVDENNNFLFNYYFPEKDEDIRKNILGKNCFVHSSVLFNKKTVLELGGYNEDISAKHIEDYDLWIKLGLKGKMYNLHECLISFTLRKGSISSKNKIDQSRKDLNLAKKYQKFYPNRFLGILKSYFRFYSFLIFNKITPNFIKNFIRKIY